MPTNAPLRTHAHGSGAQHPQSCSPLHLPLTVDSTRTTIVVLSTSVSEHSVGDAIKIRDAVRSMGMPQSSMFGTPDRYEEKNIGFVMRYVCTLEGMVKVNVPESPEPELNAPSTSQSTDKKLNGGLVTNQSEAFSGRCRLVVMR